MVFGLRYRHRDSWIWNSGAFGLGSGLLLFGGRLWPPGRGELVPASAPEPAPKGCPVQPPAVAPPAVKRGSQRGDGGGDDDEEDADGRGVDDRGCFPLSPRLCGLPSSAAAPCPPISSSRGKCSVPASRRPVRSIGPWASKAGIDSCRAAQPGSEQSARSSHGRTTGQGLQHQHHLKQRRQGPLIEVPVLAYTHPRHIMRPGVPP